MFLRQAGLTAEFDSDALRQVELDLQQPITARFNDISLREAITGVIDWETYLGAMHEVRGNRLVLTTLAAWQTRTIEAGVTDAGAKLLEDMPQLRSLSLRQEARLTDEALKSIGKLGELESLSLDSYVGTRQLGRMRFSANGIRELRGLQELRSLHLVGQEVHADALRFPKLESLGLGHAAVDDAVAAKIGELRSLRMLELTYCRIGDAGLRVIASLPELRRLDISSTTITDIG
jgi:hypothetical protein